MRTPSRANDRSRGARPARCALVASLLVVGHAAGCRCGGDAPPARDAGTLRDGSGGLDVADADVNDGATDGLIDRLIDGGGVDGANADATPVDAPGTSACPSWPRSAPAGRAWLYVEALSNGVPLTSDSNRVDVYVRRTSDPRPGERADANDPCAVASYDPAAPRVRILAAAVGFSSQEREFSPQQCLATAPCLIDLPASLDTKYYRVTANRIDLGVASNALQTERVDFAAAVAGDALARSKTLHRKLSDELTRAEKATNVPALDLAIHYTESKLHKACDARCIDEPTLDPEIRSYLKAARRPGHGNPFELRTAPDRWRVKDR